MRCKRCNGANFERDEGTGNSFCSGCGTLQEYDNYEANLGGIKEGPQGTYIRVGTIGTGSVLAYKDKKVYEAKNLIESVTERLNISGKLEEVKNMVYEITEGEFGQGEWFSVLVGACCYASVRKEGRGVLSMEEVGRVVECDLHQLGSMVKRVVEFLGLELREFDLVGLFKKTLMDSPRLNGVDKEVKERMCKQGGFLMNCALKWFLCTGRRPMPLVVAVLRVVAEVNGVKVKFEELVRDAGVALGTCRLRYKELLEKLVEVAHEVCLPWVDDVNVKNVVKHSGTLLGLMEAKSMRKGTVRRGEFCLDDIVSKCLSRKDLYQYGDDGFGDNQLSLSKNGDVNDKLSYKELVAKARSGTLTKRSDSVHQKSSVYEMVSSDDWWKGNSRMSQKLLLKEVLERDVGLDALPPSYIKGCVAVERRRERIEAAKLRINAIQYPKDVGSGNELCLEVVKEGTKKRKRGCDVDWEDLIIQTLVLHNVKDEEIEKGHYNTLLDLHVFNSAE